MDSIFNRIFKKGEEKPKPVETLESNVEVNEKKVVEAAQALLAQETAETTEKISATGSRLKDIFTKTTMAVAIIMLAVSAVEAGNNTGDTPEEFIKSKTEIKYGPGANDTTFITMEGGQLDVHRSVYEKDGYQCEDIYQNTDTGTFASVKKHRDGKLALEKTLTLDYGVDIGDIECIVGVSRVYDHETSYFTHQKTYKGEMPDGSGKFSIEKKDAGNDLSYMEDNLWAGGTTISVTNENGDSKKWYSNSKIEREFETVVGGKRTFERISIDGQGRVVERKIEVAGEDDIYIDYVYTGDGTVEKNTMDKTFKIVSKETISEDAPETKGLAEEAPEELVQVSK